MDVPGVLFVRVARGEVVAIASVTDQGCEYGVVVPGAAYREPLDAESAVRPVLEEDERVPDAFKRHAHRLPRAAERKRSYFA